MVSCPVSRRLARTRADAIASLVVVVLMLKAAAELLRASGRVLLEAAPEDMDLDDVRAHLLATEHVRGLHDLHSTFQLEAAAHAGHEPGTH